MTSQEIKDKVASLDGWLTENPEHPDYSIVLHQKWELERRKDELQDENTGYNN